MEHCLLGTVRTPMNDRNVLPCGVDIGRPKETKLNVQTAHGFDPHPVIQSSNKSVHWVLLDVNFGR